MTLRLPFTAVPWSKLLVHWYQKLVLGLFLLVIVYTLVGTTYYGTKFLIRKLRAFKKRASGATQLGAFERDLNALIQRRDIKQCSRAKSFGVFLGDLDTKLSAEQAELVSGWDIIVLDPLTTDFDSATQKAIQTLNSTLASCHSQSHLARIQLNNTSIPSEEQEIAQQSYRLLDYANLVNGVKALERDAQFWHGIVLANHSKTPIKIINSIISLCHVKQLAVFLECEAPNFIGDDNILINFDDLDGVLLRNGSLLANGRRRDYFGMAPIRKVLKIAGRQLCLKKHFSLLAYEVRQPR